MTDLYVTLKLKANEEVSRFARKAMGSLKSLEGYAAQTRARSATDLATMGQNASRIASGMGRGMLSVVSAAETVADKLSLISAESGGLAAGEMASLRESMLSVARVSRFTTSETAEGMLALARAGFTAQQQIAALPAVTKLAQATGADLAQTAAMTAKVLRGFGMDASDSMRAVDVLRAGAGAAGMTVEQMGATLAKVGPRAVGMGADLEETTAVIAAFGKAGIQGEAATQAMDTLLKRLANRSGTAAQALGAMGIDTSKGPMAILDALVTKTAGMSAGQRESGFSKMFEEAGSSISRLVDAAREGRVSLGGLDGEMRSVEGTVDRFAKIMEPRASERLKKSLEQLMITVGEQLTPAIEAATPVIGKIIEHVISFARENPRLVKTIAVVAATATGLAAVLAGGLNLAVTALAIKAALPMLTALKVTMLGAAAPVLAVSAAVGALALALDQLVKHWEKLDAMEGLQGILGRLTGGGEAKGFTDFGMLGLGKRFAQTMGELYDPRTLLKDYGLMGGGDGRIPAGAGAPAPMLASKSEVGGVIRVQVDGPGRVKGAEAQGGIEFDVSTGLALAGSAGGL